MGRTFRMGFVAHTAGCGQAVHRCSHEGFKVVFEYSVDVGPVGQRVIAVKTEEEKVPSDFASDDSEDSDEDSD